MSCATKVPHFVPFVITPVPCLTAVQHFNNWWILLFGRVTGGVATSLLFSVFEAWMVSCSFPPFLFASVP